MTRPYEFLNAAPCHRAASVRRRPQGPFERTCESPRSRAYLYPVALLLPFRGYGANQPLVLALEVQVGLMAEEKLEFIREVFDEHVTRAPPHNLVARRAFQVVRESRRFHLHCFHKSSIGSPHEMPNMPLTCRWPYAMIRRTSSGTLSRISCADSGPVATTSKCKSAGSITSFMYIRSPPVPQLRTLPRHFRFVMPKVDPAAPNHPIKSVRSARRLKCPASCKAAANVRRPRGDERISVTMKDASRRNFLSGIGLATGALAGAASLRAGDTPLAVAVTDAATAAANPRAFSTVQFGKNRITRLILGGNPIGGYSHSV